MLQNFAMVLKTGLNAISLQHADAGEVALPVGRVANCLIKGKIDPKQDWMKRKKRAGFRHACGDQFQGRPILLCRRYASSLPLRPDEKRPGAPASCEE